MARQLPAQTTCPPTQPRIYHIYGIQDEAFLHTGRSSPAHTLPRKVAGHASEDVDLYFSRHVVHREGVAGVRKRLLYDLIFRLEATQYKVYIYRGVVKRSGTLHNCVN